MSYDGHVCGMNVGCSGNKFSAKCFLCSRTWNLFCLSAVDASVESWLGAKSSMRTGVFFDCDDSLILFRCPVCKHNNNKDVIGMSQHTHGVMQHVASPMNEAFPKNGNVKIEKLIPALQEICEKQKNAFINAIKSEIICVKTTIDAISTSVAEISSVMGDAADDARDDARDKKRKKPTASGVSAERMDVQVITQATQQTQQTQPNANDALIDLDNGNDHTASMELRSADNLDSENDVNAGASSNVFNKHIHLSGFSLDMTTDHIVHYILTKTNVTDQSLFSVDCLTDVNRLKENNRFKRKFLSFKISGRDDVIKNLLEKDVWPSFVEIRDFNEHKFGIRRTNLGNSTQQYNRYSAPRTPRGVRTPSRRMNSSNLNNNRNTPMGTPSSRPRNVRFNVQSGRNRPQRMNEIGDSYYSRKYRSNNNNHNNNSNNNNQPNFLELLKMMLR